MKIHYTGEMPTEARIAIEGQIAPCLCLLPGWIQKLNVFWCADPNNETYQKGAAIWANAAYDYRGLALTFTPHWLGEPPDVRREMVIHDLLHAITGVFADYARQEIERLLPQDEAPEYQGAVLDELTTRHESMTQDFAHLIGNLIEKQSVVKPKNHKKSEGQEQKTDGKRINFR